MSSAPAPAMNRRPFLVPTVVKQCWGFMIGSTFFALGSAPGLSSAMGSAADNILFFVGAWFFTSAGLIQWFLAGPVSTPVAYAPGRMVRADWLAAATQSFGTILFNVSTTAALYAKSTQAEAKLVWNPDAGGSVAFLISGYFAWLGYKHRAKFWDPGKADWWSVAINFAGCVAFGVAAVGAYVLPDGNLADSSWANWGTFIGAICFFLASAITLLRPGRAE